MPARNELQKNNIYLFKFARVMSEFGEWLLLNFSAFCRNAETF
jgi:hypothetical protein